MGKEEELKVTQKIVKQVLIESEGARNSDAYLYYLVIERLHRGVSNKPFKEVIFNLHEMGLPLYDTVTRARRKIQEQNPELRGDDRVALRRRENEEIFRDYARS